MSETIKELEIDWNHRDEAEVPCPKTEVNLNHGTYCLTCKWWRGTYIPRGPSQRLFVRISDGALAKTVFCAHPSSQEPHEELCPRCGARSHLHFGKEDSP